MRELKGKIALVTGASMGIGAAIARELAAAGCRVAINARGRPALEEVRDEIREQGGIAEVFPCDAGDAEAVARMVDDVEASLGPVAILVNNAGAGTFKPLVQMTRDEAMLSVHLPFGAAIAACYAVVPGMIERGEGHIVNLTSPAGYMPFPNMVPYTASRTGMVGLSLSLREELEGQGIGVSLVCPPKVNTGYFERNDAGFSWYPRLAAWFPMFEPEQVANEVRRAIQLNRRQHVFPWSLRWALRLFALAPYWNLALLKVTGLFRPAR